MIEKATEARLRELEALETGWDGHDGKPITEAALKAVGMFLEHPFIGPLSYGGLQIEWHQDGWEVEVEFDDQGEIIDIQSAHVGQEERGDEG